MVNDSIPASIPAGKSPFLYISQAALGLLQHPRWKPLTIITKHSILDVAAALDLPLMISKYTSNTNTTAD